MGEIVRNTGSVFLTEEPVKIKKGEKNYQLIEDVCNFPEHVYDNNFFFRLGLFSGGTHDVNASIDERFIDESCQQKLKFAKGLLENELITKADYRKAEEEIINNYLISFLCKK